ncbi:NAD(P)/FAD-dependent oxidoreductase [Streptomyces violaceorubidus]
MTQNKDVTQDGDLTGTYDVVVVGGGAAGCPPRWSWAARGCTLVVDAGEPRNAPSDHMQGYLTRDGMSPAEFLALGREEIARYGVELVRDRAVDVCRDEDFAVRLAGGRTVRARRLIVTTGLRDELPEPCPGSPSGTAGTCCTARSATAGRCGTNASASWPPAR